MRAQHQRAAALRQGCAQMLDTLEVDQSLQALRARPPDQAGFEQRAAERLEVGLDQVVALVLGQAGQAQADVDLGDAAVAPAERMGEASEATPDRHLPAQRQHIDRSHEAQAEPQQPVPGTQEAIERDTFRIVLVFEYHRRAC